MKAQNSILTLFKIKDNAEAVGQYLPLLHIQIVIVLLEPKKVKKLEQMQAPNFLLSMYYLAQ